MSTDLDFLSWLNQLKITPPDHGAKIQVGRRLASLCKTDGGLGKLESLLIRLAGAQKQDFPSTRPRAVLVFAADHGVVSEGVSKFGPEDTGKMVRAILAGKSAVSVLADLDNTPLFCWDVGLAAEVNPPKNSKAVLRRAKVSLGTANFTKGHAMTLEQCSQAMLTGARAVRELPGDTVLLALGEMGMGNTTIASALAAAFLELEPEQVVGAGAGFSNLEYKVNVVRQALTRNPPQAKTTLEILAALGGLEVAALTGACLQAAQAGICVVLDGFVTSTAAMAACSFIPGVEEYLLSSHLAPEPGHSLVLQQLGLSPGLELELRVGEGAGALMLFPLLDQAAALLERMADFAELGIYPRGEER